MCHTWGTLWLMKRGTAVLAHPETFEETFATTTPVDVVLVSYDGRPETPRWWCLFPSGHHGWVSADRLEHVVVEADFT